MLHVGGWVGRLEHERRLGLGLGEGRGMLDVRAFTRPEVCRATPTLARVKMCFGAPGYGFCGARSEGPSGCAWAEARWPKDAH